MNKDIFLFIAIIALTGTALFFTATPSGRATWNQWFFAVQKADDSTRYETRRQVEDTCRAMLASFEADRLAYEQFKDCAGQKGSWADAALMRANQTAATYNKYVLENSFVWSANVPSDIKQQLNYITK